jgi:hypothetical protein
VNVRGGMRAGARCTIMGARGAACVAVVDENPTIAAAMKAAGLTAHRLTDEKGKPTSLATMTLINSASHPDILPDETLS